MCTCKYHMAGYHYVFFWRCLLTKRTAQIRQWWGWLINIIMTPMFTKSQITWKNYMRFGRCHYCYYLYIQFPCMTDSSLVDIDVYQAFVLKICRSSTFRNKVADWASQMAGSSSRWGKHSWTFQLCIVTRCALTKVTLKILTMDMCIN